MLVNSYSTAGLTCVISDVMVALRKPEAPPSPEVILFGNPMVFEMEPIKRIIPVSSWAWELAAVPSMGWTISPYALYILVGGAICFLLVPASLWVFLVMIMGRLADREKYRNLVENAKSIILRIDMAGDIVFNNEYAEQFYGL